MTRLKTFRGLSDSEAIEKVIRVVLFNNGRFNQKTNEVRGHIALILGKLRDAYARGARNV